MRAGLPMYLRPENRSAHDTFWTLLRAALADHGVSAPAGLDHAADMWDLWRAPDLVLSHACNLPYRSRLHGRVTLIGASDYGLPQAGPGEYYSVFVVRADDPRETPEAFAGARFALNGGDSHSGWGAPWIWAQARGLRFTPALVTGAHAESLRAVAEGRADIAALDAVTWRMLERWEPLAARVRIIGRTGPSPGQSFITRAGEDPAPYRAALAEALAALPAADALTLGLRAVIPLPESRYLDLPLPEPPDLRAGAMKNTA